MIDTITKDAQYLSGKVYHNGKFPKNLGYNSIEKQSDPENGFYAEAFFKNDKIIIAYRGTDTNKGINEATDTENTDKIKSFKYHSIENMGNIDKAAARGSKAKAGKVGNSGSENWVTINGQHVLLGN